MSFDLKSLELFVRVAALGAIGKAGAEFNLSATNATQRIQALETDFGVKLLNRTTRSVSLTPDGELLLEHAHRILDDVEDARLVLSQHAKSVSGLLRVTASATFGKTHIVPFVPEFLAQYPEVTLDLHLSDAVIDIVDQGYDLAFRQGALPSSSLLAQKVADNPQWLVASPEYLEKAGTPETPADLVNHACLGLGRQKFWQLRNSAGKDQEVPVTGARVNVNLGEAFGEFVLAGLGVGMASLWYVGPDIASGRLVRVLPDYIVVPETNLWAVRPPNRLMPMRVKAFLDFMQSRILQTNALRYGKLVEEV